MTRDLSVSPPVYTMTSKTALPPKRARTSATANSPKSPRDASEELTQVTNLIEKRRLQNRISQQNYRKYTKSILTPVFGPGNELSPSQATKFVFDWKSSKL